MEKLKGKASELMARLGKAPLGAGTIVPLIVGAVVLWEVHALLGAKERRIDEPRYLVARRPLPAGQPVTGLDFALTPAPRDAASAREAVTDQDLHLVQGAVTAAPLAAGDVLTFSALDLARAPDRLGAVVPRGLRAYALRDVDALEIDGGDRVDLVLSPHDARENAMTLVEGVTVLRARKGEGLIVALSAADIQVLEKARHKGKLTVALRNPMDAPPAGAASGRALLRPRKRGNRIEILSEGS